MNIPDVDPRTLVRTLSQTVGNQAVQIASLEATIETLVGRIEELELGRDELAVIQVAPNEGDRDGAAEQ